MKLLLNMRNLQECQQCHLNGHLDGNNVDSDGLQTKFGSKLLIIIQQHIYLWTRCGLILITWMTIKFLLFQILVMVI
jgi:hypothetical protein